MMRDLLLIGLGVALYPILRRCWAAVRWLAQEADPSPYVPYPLVPEDLEE